MKPFGVLLFLCGVSVTFSQISKPTSGTPSTGGSLPRNPPTQPDPNRGPTKTTFVTGKVMMDDGTAPPESVSIERTCGTQRRIEGHTDSQGQFAFQIGAAAQTESVIDSTADTSSMPRFGGGVIPTGTTNSPTAQRPGNGMNDTSNIRGCELRAVLPGFRSSSVNLLNDTAMSTIEVGTLILKRIGPRNGDTLSLANGMAPNGARKSFEKGKQLLAKGNVADARRELERALEAYPKYPAALVELGRLQASLKEDSEARQSFAKALEVDPKYLPPYDQLALLDLKEQKWRQLAETTSRLIQMNAYEYPQAYFLNALASLNINQPAVAIKNANEALKADPQRFSRSHYIIGLALAQQGEFAASASEIKTYLAGGITDPKEVEFVKKRLVEIERLAQSMPSPQQQ